MICLKALVLLLIGTFAAADLDSFQKSVACEGFPMQIQCPINSIINIRKAVYGRNEPGSMVCPNSKIASTNCAASTSFGKVEAACQNKQSCTIMASNSVFGDPCGGTYKYLEVYYECQSTFMETTAILTEEPSTTEELTTPVFSTTEESTTTTEELTTPVFSTTEESTTITEELTTPVFSTTEESTTTTEELTTPVFSTTVTKTKPTTQITSNVLYNYLVKFKSSKAFLLSLVKNIYTVSIKVFDKKGAVEALHIDSSIRSNGNAFETLLSLNDISNLEIVGFDEVLFKLWRLREIRFFNVETNTEFLCTMKKSGIYTCKATLDSTKSSGESNSAESSEESNSTESDSKSGESKHAKNSNESKQSKGSKKSDSESGESKHSKDSNKSVKSKHSNGSKGSDSRSAERKN